MAPTAVFATKMAQKNRAALTDTCAASVADEKAPRRVSGQHKRSGSNNRRAEDDRQNRVFEHQVLRGLPELPQPQPHHDGERQRRGGIPSRLGGVRRRSNTLGGEVGRRSVQPIAVYLVLRSYQYSLLGTSNAEPSSCGQDILSLVLQKDLGSVLMEHKVRSTRAESAFNGRA